MIAVARLWAIVLLELFGQEKPQGPLAPPATFGVGSAQDLERTVKWKEGFAIPVRVPIAVPAREFMTTLSFPEDTIETAVTGWKEGEITAVPKRGLLFLRLAKKSEGQLSVIGSSGTHYLLYLRGVEAPEPGLFDDYLKITKPEDRKEAEAVPKRVARRPSGALELLQSMRLGLRPEGTRILRARRELAFESGALEIRLLYVYDAQSYWGYVYEVRNTSGERQAVDASRLRGKGTALVLTALRENVLPPEASTRLYAVAWKDEAR